MAMTHSRKFVLKLSRELRDGWGRRRTLPMRTEELEAQRYRDKLFSLPWHQATLLLDSGNNIARFHIAIACDTKFRMCEVYTTAYLSSVSLTIIAV